MRKRIARAVMIGLVVVSVALLGVIVYPFATALLFAAVLAGAFLPLVDRLTKGMGDRRQLAASLVMLAVAVVVVLPVSILVIVLGRETIEAVDYVGDTLRSGGGGALIARLPAPVRSVLDAIGVPRSPKAIQDLAGQQ